MMTANLCNFGPSAFGWKYCFGNHEYITYKTNFIFSQLSLKGIWPICQYFLSFLMCVKESIVLSFIPFLQFLLWIIFLSILLWKPNEMIEVLYYTTNMIIFWRQCIILIWHYCSISSTSIQHINYFYP